MKKLIILIAFSMMITLILSFDAVVIFLLSGFIPGVNITLPPSMMLAVLVASTIMMAALRQWSVVYRRTLSLYDMLFDSTDKKELPSTTTKTSLPRRRYQEL